MSQSISTLRRGHDLAPRTDAGAFDVDAFHAMESRDNALVADQVMHGALTSKFTYSFDISGKKVEGVSVIGARHLAAHYGGIRHRLIASIEKRGAMHKYTTYPQPGIAMGNTTQFLPELEGEEDYYGVLIEIEDIKKGLTIQIEKMETRFERRKDGSRFERPHFQVIAQSKAFRNGILSILPQDIVKRFREECVKLGKDENLTIDAMAEKRSAILAFATKHAVPIDRMALQEVGFDQIAGLSDAARAGFDTFRASLVAVGLAEPLPETAVGAINSRITGEKASGQVRQGNSTTKPTGKTNQPAKPPAEDQGESSMSPAKEETKKEEPKHEGHEPKKTVEPDPADDNASLFGAGE